MKHFSIIFLSLITGIITLAPKNLIAQGNVPIVKIDVQRRVLDNGLTVLVWQRPSAGRIGTRMFYKVDVAAERPGTVGLTHMLEHHLFKGSDIAGTSNWIEEHPVAIEVERLAREVIDEENRNWECHLQRDVFEEVEVACSTEQLDSLRLDLKQATEVQNAYAHTTWYDWAVQSAGGTNSTASTGRDWMKFDIDLPANKLELFMWTERSRIEHPVFRHFEPEKEVVVDQIRRYDNRPDGKFSRVMRSMTYDAHPYGWAHWFSDLTQATREDHWEIFYKYFIPQNAVIVVVGDIDAEEVFDMAEKYWGSWQMGRPAPRLRTVEPSPVGQKRLIVETAAGPAVSLYVPMPAIGHPDAHVFEVLAELLGGSNGRLATELATVRRLATETAAAGWASKYPSHFEIRVDGRLNNDLGSIEAGINDVLQAIVNEGIDDVEIKAAASRLVLGLARNLNEIGRSAVTIGSMESIYRWEMLNKLPELWHGVTQDDLSRVIKTYFQKDNQIVGYLRRVSNNSVAQNSQISTQNDVLGRFTTDEVSKNLNSVRPGNWPYGGPIGEFFLNPEPKNAARINTGSAPVADFSSTISTALVSSKANEILSGIEPIAIAEQPWYTPPWMAVRRKSGFLEPSPTLDYRDLSFEPIQFVSPDPEQFRFKLVNGLDAFINQDELLPLVQITVYIDATSTQDPQNKEGLANLTSSLIRTSTKSFTLDEINSKIIELGTTLSISTDRNKTRINAMAPSENALQLIELIGSMVTEPDFTKHFNENRERQAIRASRLLDNASIRSRYLFDNALYGDAHPYGRIQHSESVRSISLDDVEQFHKHHFTAEKISIAISGKVQRDEIESALNNHFGELTSHSIEGEEPITNGVHEISGLKVITHDIDIRQGLVTMGHHGIEGQTKDHAALEIMHHILVGGGFISRMMELLRTQTGITSAVYGEVEPGRRTTNPYSWRFGGNPETIAQGIYLAYSEIQKMFEHGVTEMEFESAVTAYVDGLIPASYDTPHKLVERLAQKNLFGLYDYQSPQYLNYYAGDSIDLEQFKSLTLEDVNNAAKKYLNPNNMIITVAGPIDWIMESATPEARTLLSW
jgi:predicted Zn-dependent peptidase